MENKLLISIFIIFLMKSEVAFGIVPKEVLKHGLMAFIQKVVEPATEESRVIQTRKFRFIFESNSNLHISVIHFFYETTFPEQIYVRYLQSFCGRVISRIEEQSVISFEKTKNTNR